MKAVLYTPSPETLDRWVDRMRGLLPDWQFDAWDDADLEAVEYAIVWKPRTGDLAKLPRLKAIVSLGAGIDHVLADSELPTHIPIIRTVGQDLTQIMREYVLLHVLRHHRNRPAQVANEHVKGWDAVLAPPAYRRKVGVMGLGNLGAAAAETLASIGFQTSGWARSQKQIEGVTCYAGPDQFDTFLEGTEILVNLLPLTPETTGILNEDHFAKLPKGACLINCARGGHMDEDHLLAALDSGQIAQATLDVFQVEPLPQDHPFWTHPDVTVTTHIASRIDADTGSRIIAANLQEFEETGTVDDIADGARGY